MQKIPRRLHDTLNQSIEAGKVVVLYGPRQVGKTTLLGDILSGRKEKWKLISGEDVHVREWLSSQSVETLKANVGNIELLAIDEAQNVPQIGLNLKLMVDSMPHIKIIATGSSSFELAEQIGEPLVGRKWSFFLFPIAQLELGEHESLFETKGRLEERLVYGSYPRVITTSGIEDKRALLAEICDGYLYKDLLVFDRVRKSSKIDALLRLLAFQIGKEVSLSELGTTLGMDVRSIERYIDLLEKTFVIKRAFGFSRNLRKEVTKSTRVYFLDNGIRNAIIDNYKPLSLRNDVGELWENYLFTERMKKMHYQYNDLLSIRYFWRTYDQKEIDLVEERDGKLFGYEFKWGARVSHAPKDWLSTYKNASYEVITRENYLPFIT